MILFIGITKIIFGSFVNIFSLNIVILSIFILAPSSIFCILCYTYCVHISTFIFIWQIFVKFASRNYITVRIWSFSGILFKRFRNNIVYEKCNNKSQTVFTFHKKGVSMTAQGCLYCSNGICVCENKCWINIMSQVYECMLTVMSQVTQSNFNMGFWALM